MEAAAVHDVALKTRVRLILGRVKDEADCGVFGLTFDCSGWPADEIRTELQGRGFGVKIAQKEDQTTMTVMWLVRPDDEEIEFKKRKRIEKKLQVAAKYKKPNKD